MDSAKTIIATPRGYVRGWNSDRNCVEHTQDPDHIRRFRSHLAAARFIRQYADRGYTLNSASATIRPWGGR